MRLGQAQKLISDDEVMALELSNIGLLVYHSIFEITNKHN